ncbi:MAG: outer membrane beta-barrel protein [Bacteroidales bacterium]|nr:outer membrane beta-barrel protein [Bacteroidales bacterium]
MKKTLLTLIALLPLCLSAQTTDTAVVDTAAINAKFRLMKLKEISISAPKPVYSMTGEVVNYNVENDETVAGLTAWDAIRNAPSVQIDLEGNLSMRGSDHVDVWLNGRPTGMNGPTMKAFFESMPAEALTRVQVIKNPSAKYMVAEGHHILNIVTSARLRTSELWVLGLSGNTRPYYSPWFSYVRNTDRLKFSFHLAGSRSHFINDGHGSNILTSGDDTTSQRTYRSSSDGSSYYGNNNFNINYKIDSVTDFNLMSWNMLQGRYNDRYNYHYEQWDYMPDTAHYRYLDTSDSRYHHINGFTNFDIKRRLPGRKGHNITLGGTWNYLFSASHNESQRLISLAEGSPTSLLLQPFDRTSDNHYNRNTVDLSLRYNRPIGPHDELTLRLGGRPYGNNHRDRNIILATGLPDTLRNYVSDYHSRSLYASISLRHEWERTTLGVDLHTSLDWLRIDNRGLFPDDTLFRFSAFEPSFSLTHRTTSMHYFRFHYSYSLSTPSGGDLTQSRIYGDDSYSVGNRHLGTAATHKAALSWNRYFEKIGNVSIDAYANSTSGGIESITASTPAADPFLGRVITYTMPFNIAAAYKAGADVNFTYRPAAWASVSLNASLFQQGYHVEGEPWQERFSWTLYARLWAKVAKLVNLDANINYGAPTLGLYTTDERNITVGLGASATILDGRLSLRASVSDIFDNNRDIKTVNAPTVATTESHHSVTRFVTFGLTWRIGKLDLEWQAHGGAAGQ